MTKEKLKAGLKWKKKRWFNIRAPALFEGRVIGETLAETADQLKGKTFAVNVMQLTGNVKKQNLFLKIKVVKVDETGGHTEVQSFFMQPNSVRYLVRKGTSKMEDSFCCMTKDGKRVRAKPIAVTRAKTKSGINARINKVMAEQLVKRIAETDFDTLIVQVVNFDIQKDIKRIIDKVYPLKSFQVKFLGLETKKTAQLRTVAETSKPASVEEDGTQEITPNEESESSDAEDAVTEPSDEDISAEA